MDCGRAGSLGDKSSIEWTDATWNPTLGCSRVSEGCRNCYAERLAPRLGHPEIVETTPRGPEWTGKVLLLEKRLGVPLRWKRPRRVFVDSMSDLFHPEVPDEFIDRVVKVMVAASQHTFQVLTKRPERMAAFLRARWGVFRPVPNIWWGTSVENQAAADERVPHLLRTPAAVRFLSCEPLLNEVDLREWIPHGYAITRGKYGGSMHGLPNERCTHCGESQDSVYMGNGGKHAAAKAGGLHWVIVGGESGPDARPMDIAWARSLVAQCKEAGVACFVKQLGARPDYEKTISTTVGHPEWDRKLHYPWPVTDRRGGDPAEWPEDLRVREFPVVLS